MGAGHLSPERETCLDLGKSLKYLMESHIITAGKEDRTAAILRIGHPLSRLSVCHTQH